MSPNGVLSFFRTLVDDSPDVDEEAVLMDVAYTKRNESRFWTFLLKLDTSITHSSGDLWTTEKSLPSDFEEPYKLHVGTSGIEYDPVPFEEILRWQGSANRFTIDYANAKLRFLGPGPGDTVYLWYKYGPTSLIGLTADQKDATTTIVWPKRFCPILAFDMAAMHMGGVDADDTTRQQVPYQNAAHKELVAAMVTWDNKRRMKLFDNSASSRRMQHSERADVVSGYPS